ncbi:sulfotransferase 6B1 [Bombina bombina]|uniref:sulfotransferase 6B1 n=1 Tax=Bombina bombina TaxID=8345 RepID=UPI00235AE5FE|nr:sulfotransferase 6B1 [Bombina bombina]
MSASDGASQQRGKFRQDMETILDKASKMSSDELMFSYEGFLYPSLVCSKETIEALKSFEAREDDLLNVTYPKCGTNWVIQILREMVYSLNNKESLIDQAIIELIKPDILQNLKNIPSPRVLSTHFYYDAIPNSFLEKKVKMLVVFRNPKDAAVSYFHFYNNNPVLPNYSSWDVFFQHFISGKVFWGSYFDHAVVWNKHIDDENVLLLTFEEMKEDLPLQLKKISDFYGLALTDEQIQLVASKTTFTSMKDKSKTTHGKLSEAFFRKGEIGDWKSLFTEAQSKEVDAKFEQYLGGTKLGEKLKYKKYCTF